VLAEMEVIKEELEITNSGIEHWYFGGNGAEKYGANASLIQTERLVNSRNKLFDRLETLERAKSRIQSVMERFEGIEYEIAYKRIVECKTHQEIADELGYSHQYIREKWARMKTNKEHTDFIENV